MNLKLWIAIAIAYIAGAFITIDMSKDFTDSVAEMAFIGAMWPVFWIDVFGNM